MSPGRGRLGCVLEGAGPGWCEIFKGVPEKEGAEQIVVYIHFPDILDLSPARGQKNRGLML